MHIRRVFCNQGVRGSNPLRSTKLHGVPPAAFHSARIGQEAAAQAHQSYILGSTTVST